MSFLSALWTPLAAWPAQPLGHGLSSSMSGVLLWSEASCSCRAFSNSWTSAEESAAYVGKCMGGGIRPTKYGNVIGIQWDISKQQYDIWVWLQMGCTNQWIWVYPYTFHFRTQMSHLYIGTSMPISTTADHNSKVLPQSSLSSLPSLFLSNNLKASAPVTWRCCVTCISSPTFVIEATIGRQASEH